MLADSSLTLDLKSLETFLSRFVRENWIQAFRIEVFASQKDLRRQWGHADLKTVSRTHKRLNAHQLMGVEVIKNPQSQVGIDLESCESLKRPLFQQTEFLAERFSLNRDISSIDLMGQWIGREACFKSMYPQNSHLLLSSFSFLEVVELTPQDHLLLADDLLQSPTIKKFRARCSAPLMDTLMSPPSPHPKINGYQLHLSELFFAIARVELNIATK